MNNFYCYQKAQKALYSENTDRAGLKLVYEQYVRSILEYASVSVYPMLNAAQMSLLESVQRAATRTISDIRFSPERPRYFERLRELHMKPLSERWAEHFTRFAESMENEPRFARFMILNPSTHTMSTIEEGEHTTFKGHALKDLRKALSILSLGPKQRKDTCWELRWVSISLATIGFHYTLHYDFLVMLNFLPFHLLLLILNSSFI